MGLRIWPERSPSGVAHSAQMWEGDEGMLLPGWILAKLTIRTLLAAAVLSC